MATFNASTLQDIQYSGDCPLATAHGSYTMASTASGSVIRLNKLYAGTKIVDAHMVCGDTGAGQAGSTTIALGFEYVNGEAGGAADSFIAATDVSQAATSTRMAKPPVTLAYDAYIIATLAGGTAATAQLDTVMTYEFKGK